jgi:hypothetical protein
MASSSYKQTHIESIHRLIIENTYRLQERGREIEREKETKPNWSEEATTMTIVVMFF